MIDYINNYIKFFFDKVQKELINNYIVEDKDKKCKKFSDLYSINRVDYFTLQFEPLSGNIFDLDNLRYDLLKLNIKPYFLGKYINRTKDSILIYYFYRRFKKSKPKEVLFSIKLYEYGQSYRLSIKNIIGKNMNKKNTSENINSYHNLLNFTSELFKRYGDNLTNVKVTKNKKDSYEFQIKINKDLYSDKTSKFIQNIVKIYAKAFETISVKYSFSFDKNNVKYKFKFKVRG